MIRRLSQSLGPVLGWLAFPLAPVILENIYHQFICFNASDPYQWDWVTLGARDGAPLGLWLPGGGDAGPARRPGSARGAVVAVAPGGLGRGRPWLGFVACAGLFWAYLFLINYVSFPPTLLDSIPTMGWIVTWALGILFCGTFAYGWLIFAHAAVRARRGWAAGRGGRAGLAMMVGFAGSLFGSFWAVTAAWRSFFFDPRVVPLLLAASGAALACGCSSQETVGDVRRRELFQALLMAWVLGLALSWRWWSRSRTKPPRP